MGKFFLIILLAVSSSLFAFDPPTARYVVHHPLEEIKYNLRLEGATFEQKPIFDKVMAQEASGFFGYFAATSEFRTYQDLIRMIFEEKLAVNVPKDFHFLAVPLYPKRQIKSLEAIYRNYFVDQFDDVVSQLFPFTLWLYANHKSIGFCPAKNFALGTHYQRLHDLEWLCSTLGIDEELIAQANQVRLRYFAAEDRLLLQLFDTSPDPYSFIDTLAYPAYPFGYPYKNQALSDYALGVDAGFCPQFFLVLDERTILNPQAPFVVTRYTKIQPASLKAYEAELKGLVKAASCNQERATMYYNQLQQEWNR